MYIRHKHSIGVSIRVGPRLHETLRPALDDIDAKLAALSELRDKPVGTVRISTSKHAAETILWPAVTRMFCDYPDAKVELSFDAALTDIVAERFDAGVRLGEQVAKDMIAVPIGPDLRMAVVGAPSYFAERDRPQISHDLTRQRCINVRQPTKGGIYAWEFGKDGRDLHGGVDGPLVLNDLQMVLNAAAAGIALA